MAKCVSDAYLVGPNPAVLPGKYAEETIQQWKKFIGLQWNELVLRGVITFDTTPLMKLCAPWRTADGSHYADGRSVGHTFIPPGMTQPSVAEGVRNMGWGWLVCNYLVHVQLAVQYFHGLDPFLVQLACDFAAEDISITSIPRNPAVQSVERPVSSRPAPSVGREFMSSKYHIDVMQSGIVIIHTNGMGVMRLDDYPEHSGATAIFLTLDNVEMMGIAVNERANIGPKHLAVGGVPPGTMIMVARAFPDLAR
jgi:hypothetical protein